MLTQDDLARLAGLDRSTIVRLEQEPESAYDATIIKLAQALGMDQYELRDLFRDERRMIASSAPDPVSSAA